MLRFYLSFPQSLESGGANEARLNVSLCDADLSRNCSVALLGGNCQLAWTLQVGSLGDFVNMMGRLRPVKWCKRQRILVKDKGHRFTMEPGFSAKGLRVNVPLGLSLQCQVLCSAYRTQLALISALDQPCEETGSRLRSDRN